MEYGYTPFYDAHLQSPSHATKKKLKKKERKKKRYTHHPKKNTSNGWFCTLNYTVKQIYEGKINITNL